MDADSAKRFKFHLDDVAKHLTLALSVAKESCTEKEFLEVRKFAGDVLGHMDTLLYTTVYKDHPDLETLSASE
jgi:hypothetical protein